MFTAGQSPQVAEKNKQDVLPALSHGLQINRCAADHGQGKGRGGLADRQFAHLLTYRNTLIAHLTRWPVVKTTMAAKPAKIHSIAFGQIKNPQ